MAKLIKELEKFFIYFFTGISVFVVVLGIQRAKHSDAFGVTPAPEDRGNKDASLSETTQDTETQQANILGAMAPASAGKVLSASETVSSIGKIFTTPWGDLSTSINIKDGKIIAVDIPTLPNSPQSVYAKPILIDETLKAGSANVQAVTGATITSNAFKASLESAIAIAKTKNPRALVNAQGKTIPATASPAPKNTAVTKKSPAGAAIKITETPLVVDPVVQPTTTPAPVAPAGVSGTFTGNAYSTPWGNAVASITLVNGKIVGVTMPQVPNSPPSAYAEPYLVQQALYTGSANIQGVSGATVVSNAFKLSLESAIAKASAQGNVSPTTTPVVQTITQPTPPPPAPVQTPAISAPVIVQPATPPPPAAPASVSGTFTGNAYSTNWGNASAQVTFTNGVITNVTMPQIPNSPPSIQAAPYLVQQALAAGSANIQGVSGATIVSNAFKLSLESAIAKASAQGTISAPTTPTATVAPAPAPATTRTRKYDDD